AKGAPDHPHRGFETVTYLLSGEMEHKDSQGHAGKLRPGDVQWMTAGAGGIHSEMPSAAFQRDGGKLPGFQTWGHRASQNKMMRPRYQEIPLAMIPTARTTDGLVDVRVIAGEALGARAVIETVTPIMYLHFTVQPGGRITQPVPREYNAFAYIIDGGGLFGAERDQGSDGEMVLFALDRDEIRIEHTGDAEATLEVLIIVDIPLHVPVPRYHP